MAHTLYGHRPPPSFSRPAIQNLQKKVECRALTSDASYFSPAGPFFAFDFFTRLNHDFFCAATASISLAALLSLPSSAFFSARFSPPSSADVAGERGAEPSGAVVLVRRRKGGRCSGGHRVKKLVWRVSVRLWVRR